MVTNNEIFVFAIYYYNIIGLQFVFLVDFKIQIPGDRWFTDGGYMSNNRTSHPAFGLKLNPWKF